MKIEVNSTITGLYHPISTSAQPNNNILDKFRSKTKVVNPIWINEGIEISDLQKKALWTERNWISRSLQIVEGLTEEQANLVIRSTLENSWFYPTLYFYRNYLQSLIS